MSNVIMARGTRTSPYFSVAASLTGTARFTNLIPTRGRNGRVARQVRFTGRLVGGTSGGTPALAGRVVLVSNGVRPTDGSGAGNTMGEKLAFGGLDSDSPTLATTGTTQFSVVANMNTASTQSGSTTRVPADHVCLRISNSGGAYTGGTVFVDRVELLD